MTPTGRDLNCARAPVLGPRVGGTVGRPAFGSFTGGLNVLDAAFQPLFGNGGLDIWLLGQEGLYPIASRLLRED